MTEPSAVFKEVAQQEEEQDEQNYEISSWSKNAKYTTDKTA